MSESGTAMRFVCAYLSVTTQRPVRLFGRGRQHERPIAPLVEALRSQGAKITYLDHEGYPPLLIEPSTFSWQGCELDASASSQYLSALLLLAPLLPVGFEIDTRCYGLASRPYALMTKALLREQGFVWEEEPDSLFCYRGKRGEDSQGASTLDRGYEADWSGASYAFAWLSLLPLGSTMELPGLCYPSLQGDAGYLVSFFKELGVKTLPNERGIFLQRIENVDPIAPFTASMHECPDLVPALVTALVGQGRAFTLTGVAHLRIKESDRLEALRVELAKLGVGLSLGEDSISWDTHTRISPMECPPILATHGDHRIAMALSVLTIPTGTVLLEHPEVVSKSFPRYWEELTPFLMLDEN